MVDKRLTDEIEYKTMFVKMMLVRQGLDMSQLAPEAVGGIDTLIHAVVTILETLDAFERINASLEPL